MTTVVSLADREQAIRAALVERATGAADRPYAPEPTGTCQECGRDIAVMVTGTLRFHGHQPVTGSLRCRVRCRGAGRPPVELMGDRATARVEWVWGVHHLRRHGGLALSHPARPRPAVHVSPGLPRGVAPVTTVDAGTRCQTIRLRPFRWALRITAPDGSVTWWSKTTPPVEEDARWYSVNWPWRTRRAARRAAVLILIGQQ